MTHRMLNKGDRVLIHFPSDEPAVTYKMRKRFEGVESVVRKVTKGKWQVRFYELKNCKSDFGVNYTFIEDWLIPLDSEEFEGW